MKSVTPASRRTWEQRQFSEILRRIVRGSADQIRKQRKGPKDASLKDKDVARHLDMSPYVFSRLINGFPPKDYEVLAKAAKELSATAEDICELLALACAIHAGNRAEDGKSLARHYFLMMSRASHYDADLLRGARRGPNIIDNVLRDVGIEQTEEVECAIRTLVGGRKCEDLNGSQAAEMILKLRELVHDKKFTSQLAKQPIGKVWDLAKTYERIVAVDFNSRARTCEPGKPLSGSYRARTYPYLRKVNVTHLVVEPNSQMEHAKHPGVELSFLCRGSGKFILGGSLPVCLSTNGRRFIAFPTSEDSHTFIAGDHGAEFVVFEYRPRRWPRI